MRNYWLRIVLGALAIFGVGMVLWSMVRAGRHRVEEVVHSDAPITIPLAFIPFKVDGRDLGTLSRLEILRQAPGQVKALNFRVKLADSASENALASCVMVAGNDGKDIGTSNTFTCSTSADTAGRGLEAIGRIETQSGRTFVLLAQQGALRNFDVSADVDSKADSITAHYEQMADSIEQAADSISAAADSVRAMGEARADSIRQQGHDARQMSDSIRREVRRQVDDAKRAAREARRTGTPTASGAQ